MLFKSQIIAAASGSIGGCTYSHNRFGQYIRNRTVPVNTNTSQQQAVRNSFQQLASRWVSVLTQAERDAWDVYAGNVPVVGPLGDPRHLTGLNWYIACNTPRLQAGETIQDDAPTIFSQADLTISSVVASETNSLDILFPAGQAWAAAVNGGLMVYVSRPFSPSINFFAGPYQFADFIEGAAVPPTSPQTVVTPFAMTAGQKVGVGLRAFLPDGRISGFQRFTTIVTV